MSRVEGSMLGLEFPSVYIRNTPFQIEVSGVLLTMATS